MSFAALTIPFSISFQSKIFSKGINVVESRMISFKTKYRFDARKLVLIPNQILDDIFPTNFVTLFTSSDLLYRIFFFLQIIELCVQASQRCKFVMSTAFGDLSVIQDDDLVRHSGSRNTV